MHRCLLFFFLFSFHKTLAAETTTVLSTDLSVDIIVGLVLAGLLAAAVLTVLYWLRRYYHHRRRSKRRKLPQSATGSNVAPQSQPGATQRKESAASRMLRVTPCSSDVTQSAHETPPTGKEKEPKHARDQKLATKTRVETTMSTENRVESMLTQAMSAQTGLTLLRTSSDMRRTVITPSDEKRLSTASFSKLTDQDSKNDAHLIEFFFDGAARTFDAYDHYRHFVLNISQVRCCKADAHPKPHGKTRTTPFRCRADTRVIIAGCSGHFVSANWAGRRKNLILTEAPTPETAGDFYLTVLACNVRAIVMLVPETDIGTPYYPTSEEEPPLRLALADGSHVAVTCTAKKTLEDVAIATLQLSWTSAAAKSKTVVLQHVHIPFWKSLIEISAEKEPYIKKYGRQSCALFDTINDLVRNDSRPVLIHCVDGTGRTGAFALTMEIIAELMFKTLGVSPTDIASGIRRARDGAIETPEEMISAVAVALFCILHRHPSPTEHMLTTADDYETSAIDCLKNGAFKEIFNPITNTTTAGQTTTGSNEIVKEKSSRSNVIGGDLRLDVTPRDSDSDIVTAQIHK